MIVKIEFDYENDTEYIRCTAKVGRNIRKLQRQFDKWIYDRNNKHPYWELAHIDEEGYEIYGVCFDAEAFVYWLNHVKYVKRKKVARLVEKPNEPPKKKLRF
ncbi:hypothetical protein [Niallia circulans]|uniref:hypothetical protein n=1 Tax=Niallia circulans TaxID=1397 RepID=UPI00300A82FA